jgi:hypothetical protein
MVCGFYLDFPSSGTRGNPAGTRDGNYAQRDDLVSRIYAQRIASSKVRQVIACLRLNSRRGQEVANIRLNLFGCVKN